MADYLDVSTFGELEETAKEEAAKEEATKEGAGEESNCNSVDKELLKDCAYYNNENKSLILDLTA